MNIEASKKTNIERLRKKIISIESKSKLVNFSLSKGVNQLAPRRHSCSEKQRRTEKNNHPGDRERSNESPELQPLHRRGVPLPQLKMVAQVLHHAQAVRLRLTGAPGSFRRPGQRVPNHPGTQECHLCLQLRRYQPVHQFC